MKASIRLFEFSILASF